MPFPASEEHIAQEEAKLSRRLPEPLPVSAQQEQRRRFACLDHDWDESWRLYPVWDPTNRRTVGRTANNIVRETESLRRELSGIFPGDAIAVGSNDSGDQHCPVLTARCFMLVSTDMKARTEAGPRPYRLGARAEAAAQTRVRILRAALDLHTERFHDQITLEDIATRAGVTVQTVLRRFGSRGQLVAAAGEYAEREVVGQRFTAPVGDIDGAVDNLLDHYEEWGRSALRLLAQEERVPQLRALADRGRAAHYEWVDRTFAPYLRGTSDSLRRAKLITLTDVFVWKLLRLDLGVDRARARSALIGMLRAVVAEEGPA